MIKTARIFLAAASVFLFAAQCHARDPFVSVILSSDMEFYKNVSTGFKMYFANKGTTIRINEYSLKSQDPAGIFSKINSDKPDLILTVGEDALNSARQHAAGIPLVFTMVFNAKASAEENIAGILLDISPDMKIAGIKKVLPSAKTISMLYSKDSIASYNDIKTECDKRAITLNARQVNDNAEFMSALNSVFPGSDCFLVILDPRIYFTQTLKLLLLQSFRQKVPVIGLSSFYTKAGVIASFDCDYRDLGQQAGEIAAKVIAGEQASGYRPVRPRKFRYSINLITAEKLGIRIPGNIIKEASEVFEN